MPLLIFLGLTANIANATNRVAILLQNVAAVAGFRRHGVFDGKIGAFVALPAVLGAAAGASVAARVKPDRLERVIGVVLLMVLLSLLMRPQRWLQEASSGQQRFDACWRNPAAYLRQWPVYLAVGFYAGFVQVGVGVILLATLVWVGRMDLVRSNALKVFVILWCAVAATAVFGMHRQIRWDVGLVLSVGNMSGAWTAAHLAATRGSEFVRIVLILVLAFSSFKLLGGVELLQKLVTA
ncbi:MAG: sulfite exporter TauE/SafE family protein [Planctomycetota bacterium]|nr:MAG: sulfite exporter TauE/SafE family protein [Planctomycetota bacterium]